MSEASRAQLTAVGSHPVHDIGDVDGVDLGQHSTGILSSLKQKDTRGGVSLACLA